VEGESGKFTNFCLTIAYSNRITLIKNNTIIYLPDATRIDGDRDGGIDDEGGKRGDALGTRLENGFCGAPDPCCGVLGREYGTGEDCLSELFADIGGEDD
jgi:hypothetical protein